VPQPPRNPNTGHPIGPAPGTVTPPPNTSTRTVTPPPTNNGNNGNNGKGPRRH
jgi:hypothetical protein